MAEQGQRVGQPVVREDVAAAQVAAAAECTVGCNMAERYRRAEQRHRAVRNHRAGLRQAAIATDCHYG